MNVLVVDDTRLFREGIANLLRAQGHQVVGEAADGREAIAKAAALNPELILMDLRMPVLDGLGATQAIKAQQPQVKIVLLTVSDDEDDLLEAVKRGADGYLLKDITADELFNEIETLRQGGAVITKSIAGKLMREFQRPAKEREKPSPNSLSARELEVLRAVSTGCSNKETAEQLFISENTVKYHMKRILEKLQLDHRAQVVAWAARNIDTRPSS